MQKSVRERINGIKMIREIELNNKTIQYELQYKKVKNINLRIKPDGSVNVSANWSVPQNVIDEFIISKADFIISALKKYKDEAVKEQVKYFTEDELKALLEEATR